MAGIEKNPGQNAKPILSESGVWVVFVERHLSPFQLGPLLNSDGRTDHKLTPYTSVLEKVSITDRGTVRASPDFW